MRAKKRNTKLAGPMSNCWHFTRRDSTTFEIHRTFFMNDRGFTFDVTNEYWMFGWITVDNASLCYRKDDEILQFPHSSYGIFLPPFSITEIGLSNARFEAHMYVSSERHDDIFPRKPLLFASNEHTMPTNSRQVAMFLNNAENPRCISRSTRISTIAGTIKAAIDGRYDTSENLASIAGGMRLPANLFSMYFKRAFHLTPSRYRKQLRIVYSITRLLSCGISEETISSIALDSGYGDVGRFNKQFKAMTGVSPKEMKL
ncbi:MAG: helix-turn-helix transcriptional regulator [Chitinivibrionales bacterium]|nr:helix-turn-helix transcriptional regulator [Chitinivibrionales bacterium]